jgi:hypothetical protein
MQKIRRPSPAMVVACIALVMATTGSAVAAVSYATNAGKVDGKDAVYAGAKLSQAAGDLVATNRSGPDKGKIPGKFLADVMRGGADSFSRNAEVVDNASDVPTAISSIPGLGTLSASCFDQNKKPGVEDPATTLTFGNTSGLPLNIARRVGERGPDVFPQLANTTSQFTVGASNTFRLHIEKQGTNYVIEGVVRQDGRNTPGAFCVVYGYALRIADVA